jgi:hypothetical protein
MEPSPLPTPESVESALKDLRRALAVPLARLHREEQAGIAIVNTAALAEPDNPHRNSSWMSGHCRECGYPVVVTQAKDECMDYWWYCSHKSCTWHKYGEQTGDMEQPEWVVL